MEFRDILASGVASGASDWHLKENGPVCLRISGEIIPHDFVTSREYLGEVISRIATVQTIAKYEEIGDADFAFEEKDIGRFRVNVHRQRGTMSLTLRHVKDQVPDLKTLRLPEIILPLSEARNGIIFVTGSTGSGKSTTLACMLQHLNQNFRRHIITIEDPIEYNFIDDNCIIEQREVGLDTVSFDSALRHALRQDPDVIVLGELRNRDSFETALAAAETGHLVMTTLHTSNASQSIGRILDFYPFEERDGVRKNLAANLRAVICQRLVPKIGRGVVPINEVLINTPIVTQLIEDGDIPRLDAAIENGVKDGMQNFNMALIDLVKNNDVEEETALKFASNAETLKMNLKGIFLSQSGGIVG
ncbi:MAG: PilT/PilU family type 4a pilus ATPase [Verrucomicrobiota bacterium]